MMGSLSLLMPPEREPDEQPGAEANVSATPQLPEVESPPPEDVLAGVPSKEEIIDEARSAEKVIEQQPSVDELLGRDRPGARS